MVSPLTDKYCYATDAAQWHATERARLVKIGRTPSFADEQIAAIAKVDNLILLTNNVVNYADFLDLQIKNWFIQIIQIYITRIYY